MKPSPLLSSKKQNAPPLKSLTLIALIFILMQVIFPSCQAPLEANKKSGVFFWFHSRVGQKDETAFDMH